ncbi:MAG: PBP1A family penicillin-binding protein [Myxococcota bacterium]|nr:PBP1A family penicillin-binding protein [Myxococcota bacterium]
MSAILGGAALTGIYLYFAQGLPDIRSIADYQPPQTTRILAADGTVIGTFSKERRTLIGRTQMPDVLIHAILSAEDADFFEHEGLDYMGMMRALYNSLKAGRVTGSGSTITQQTVKNLLLTPERSFRRKARELILARRLDSTLSKDDILTIYLNAIYLGHGRYGVEAASRYYFSRSAQQLNLNQAAILAGLIQSPERISPRKHPDRARARRGYVLRQMKKNNYITDSELTEALEQPLGLAPRPTAPDGDFAYFVSEVRQRLVKQFGETAVLTGGMTVHTTIDPLRQRAAVKAVRDGLIRLDKRQGFTESPTRLIGPMVADWQRKRRKALGGRAPTLGRVVRARVEKVTADRYHLDLGIGKARLPRRIDARLGSKKTKSFKVGDIIQVKLRADGPAHPKVMWASLADVPQAAFVAISMRDRGVKAMVGGWHAKDYPFNRVTRAKRQPGSAFKPFVWGAAMDSRRLTPASTLIDAPETLRVFQGQFWQPKNYTGKFRGLISLRTALAHSVNSVAVHIAETVGISRIQSFARKTGLTSPLARGLAIALGASEVTPIELVNAYVGLTTGQSAQPPRFITKIEHRSEQRSPESVTSNDGISPEVAFLVRSMLRSVVTEGSGRALSKIDRPVVGKTGTTNAARDAWFVGALPDIVFGVWVGFDSNRPLGKKESGGRTAAPIIADYVRAVELDGEDWPPAPDGIETRKVVSDGRLAPPTSKKGREEFFLIGTEPRETAPAEGQLDTKSFFFEGEGQPANTAEQDVTPVAVPKVSVTPLQPSLMPVKPVAAKSVQVPLGDSKNRDSNALAKPGPLDRVDLKPVKPTAVLGVQPVRVKPTRTLNGTTVPQTDEPVEIQDEDRP